MASKASEVDPRGRTRAASKDKEEELKKQGFLEVAGSSGSRRGIGTPFLQGGEEIATRGVSTLAPESREGGLNSAPAAGALPSAITAQVELAANASPITAQVQIDALPSAIAAQVGASPSAITAQVSGAPGKGLEKSEKGKQRQNQGERA